MTDTEATRRSCFATCGAFGLGAFACGVLGDLGWPAFAAVPEPLRLSDAEWRKRLSPRAYAILRKSETERPFSSPLNKEHCQGRFSCAGCAQPLFSSATKFESGTGWPSFYDHLPDAIGKTVDRSLGMSRTEVHCARCAGHLGHMFTDGPKPTGLRYCMNGASMTFESA